MMDGEREKCVCRPCLFGIYLGVSAFLLVSRLARGSSPYVDSLRRFDNAKSERSEQALSESYILRTVRTHAKGASRRRARLRFVVVERYHRSKNSYWRGTPAGHEERKVVESSK